MATTAALLGSLLCTKADVNYYNQQLIAWNAKYEANNKKLQEQMKYEEKYVNHFDSAIDNTKQLKAKNVIVNEGNQNEMIADAYAHAKVEKYDEDLSNKYAELDVNYDAIVTTLKVLIEESEANEQGLEERTGQAAQDTGLIGK